MPDSGPHLPLALLHLRRLLAVLLDRSRPEMRRNTKIRSRRARSARPPTPTQDFFGADSLTSKFSFARSEHGLRDGSGIPQPDTRKRAPILAF